MKNLLSENAAILIIGNEILSGRTEDKNFNYIAKKVIKKVIDRHEEREKIRKRNLVDI